MFRPTKKRPRKPAIIRTKDAENGDESPDETTIQRPPKKKKQKRPVVMSFDLDEAAPTVGKKRRKKGMGFGGAPVLVEQQEEDSATTTTNSQNGAINGAEPAAMYGKDALSKLKSQQKYKPREEKEAASQMFRQATLLLAKLLLLPTTTQHFLLTFLYLESTKMSFLLAMKPMTMNPNNDWRLFKPQWKILFSMQSKQRNRQSGKLRSQVELASATLQQDPEQHQ